MQEQNNRTNFTTVLSWILIVFSGIGLLMAIVQNILINLMFESSIQDGITHTSKGFTGFIFSNLNIFVFILGLLILLSFISALGLLKRKNWARIIYIILFVVGIIYMISFVLLQWGLMNSIIQHAPQEDFGSIFYLTRIFITVIILGLCVLFGWLIRKLTSVKIKAEFKNNY